MKKIIILIALTSYSLVSNAQYRIQNFAKKSQSSINSNFESLYRELDSNLNLIKIFGENERSALSKNMIDSMKIQNYKIIFNTKMKLEEDRISKTKDKIKDKFKTAHYYQIILNEEKVENYNQLLTGSLIDSFDVWRQDILNLNSINDSLKILHYKERLKYNSTNWFNFKPSMCAAMFDILYADSTNTLFSTLRESNINYGKNSISLYSEVVNGRFFFTRASLGLMVTSSVKSDSFNFTANEAYQRLATKGGNLVLNFETPLYYSSFNNQNVNLYLKWNKRGTLDLPNFNYSILSDVALSIGTGLELYTDIASDDNKNFRFFGKINANYIYGNKVFKDKLGFANNSIWMSQATVGILIKNMFAINFVVPIFISDKKYDNGDIIVGGQILR